MRNDYLIATLLFALSAIGLVVISGGQPSFGPDGANAIHIARNVVAGEGLVTKIARLGDVALAPTPFVVKPPLYASSIALLTWLGIPALIAGLVISIGAFSVAIAMLYLLARQVLPLGPALLVPLFFGLQINSIRWGITIHEQSLFVVLTLATLWRLAVLSRPNFSVHWGQYFALGILAALSILASYQGLPVLIVASLFVVLLSQAERTITKLAAFGAGMATVGAWPFLRFIMLWADGIRVGFFEAPSDTTYYKMLAGIPTSFQNDTIGTLVVWLYDGSHSDVAIVAAFYIILGGLLLFAFIRCRELRPAVTFVALYMFLLIYQLGSAGKVRWEPRYVMPVYGPIFLLVIYFLHEYAKRLRKRYITIGLLAVALIIFVYGQSHRYSKFVAFGKEMCPAPQTIRWIQQHVPSDGIIAATQCGYQLIAETSDYYWLQIPPANDFQTPVRWDESDFLAACRITDNVFVALMLGEGKDPFRLVPGYGPYVDRLFGGEQTDLFTLVARLDDGVVYQLSCQ